MRNYFKMGLRGRILKIKNYRIRFLYTPGALDFFFPLFLIITAGGGAALTYAGILGMTTAGGPRLVHTAGVDPDSAGAPILKHPLILESESDTFILPLLSREVAGSNLGNSKGRMTSKRRMFAFGR